MADSDIQQREEETILVDIDWRVGATQHELGDGVPDAPLPMGSAWRASDLTEADWKIRIPEAALQEFEIIAGALEEYDEPLDTLSPDSFDWPATTDLMADVRARLSSGLGFGKPRDDLAAERDDRPADHAEMAGTSCL